MTFNLNFFIIMFILILVLVYFNSSTKEHFVECSTIEPIPIDSFVSTNCPEGCKPSKLDDKNIQCVNDV